MQKCDNLKMCCTERAEVGGFANEHFEWLHLYRLVRFLCLFYLFGMNVLKWLNFQEQLISFIAKVVAPFPCFRFGNVFITSTKYIFKPVLN